MDGTVIDFWDDGALMLHALSLMAALPLLAALVSASGRDMALVAALVAAPAGALALMAI